MALYEYITSTGTIIPDVADILTQVEDEYKAIFGDDFVTDPETPEGVLIAMEANSREALARNNAQLANQINPNLAGGVYLDALWALLGGSRNPATRSLVTVTLTGVATTVIPAGSIAETDQASPEDRVQFRSTEVITIPVSGTIDAVFESVETGPQPAAANSLTVIVSAVLGWETVDNAAVATLGQEQESDADARNRRRQTLAVQGHATAEAIVSQILSTENVRSMSFRENVTSSNQGIGGDPAVTLVPHSIWACVQGGTDEDVAQAIFDKKSAGSDFNGLTEVDITDQYSGQVYTVKFDRPTEVPIEVTVEVRASSVIAADPQQAIPDSIVAYANGELPGEDGFIVDADVSAFELSGAILRRNPEYFIQNVQVAYLGQSLTDVLPIEINQVATIDPSNITVIEV